MLNNIQKCKIILTDFSKALLDQMSFDADVTFSGPNTDSFAISISSYTSNLTAFSFSIIVIMTQS